MLKTIVFWYFLGFLTCEGHVTFTNLKCTFANKSIGEFTQCEIKAVNRTHKYFSLYEKVHLKPLDNITVNVKLMRYNNGYKPFFIDFTIDACMFMRNQRHPLAITIYRTIREYTNMNHTCPYEHDIIIDKMWTGDLDKDMLKYIPNLTGDFALFTKWYMYNKPLLDVNIYLRITKDHK